jgi:hypothetical protein
VLTACLKGLYVLTAKAKAPTSITNSSNVTACGVAVANEARPVPKSLNQLYVLVVCVLILVQDGPVLRALHKHSDIDLRWYLERPSDAVSTSTVMFIVLPQFVRFCYGFHRTSLHASSNFTQLATCNRLRADITLSIGARYLV